VRIARLTALDDQPNRLSFSTPVILRDDLKTVDGETMQSAYASVRPHPDTGVKGEQAHHPPPRSPL